MTRIIHQIILDTVSDLVSDFSYYDRKEDEELNIEQLDDAILSRVITIDEIVAHFKEELIKVYKE